MTRFFSLLFFFLIFNSGAAQTNSIPKKQQPKLVAENLNPPAKDSVINPYYIIIHKKTYELEVYDDTGWLYTYPVVFGSKDLGDKMMEGDRKTPNGEYKIILKKKHKQWGEELLLDYPTERNIELFKQRKASGILSKKAKIGNGIAIHGTMPDSDWTVENFVNWTDGCISLRSDDMKELFTLIPNGTKVTIKE